MKKYPYSYLFRIQYLGLRYHGWQVQKGVKTVQGVLERTIKHVLGHSEFNLLGANRTDSGVSSIDGAFELFLGQPFVIENFIPAVNDNLPSDIRVVRGQVAPDNFNIIQDVGAKQYAYYFTFGEKPHPLLMANLAYAGPSLSIEVLMEAIQLFKGRHDFRRFCTQGKDISDFVREITAIQLVEEQAPWCPSTDFPIYVFRVEGSGFLMHQLRRMMYALWMVGRAELSLGEIRTALTSPQKHPLSPKAPAQGLVLEKLTFKDKRID